MDGRKPGDEQKPSKPVHLMGKSVDSTTTASFIESHLDPVAEESEDEFKRLSSHKELTLDGDKGKCLLMKCQGNSPLMSERSVFLSMLRKQ